MPNYECQTYGNPKCQITNAKYTRPYGITILNSKCQIMNAKYTRLYGIYIYSSEYRGGDTKIWH